MFGKQQPNVVTDEDVGNYIAQLDADTPDPLTMIIDEVEDGLADDSERTATESQGEDRLP